MRKILFLFLAVLLLIFILPQASFSQTQEGVFIADPENSFPVYLGIGYASDEEWVAQLYVPVPRLKLFGFFTRAWFHPTPTWELGPALSLRAPLYIKKSKWGEREGLELMFGGWAPIVPESTNRVRPFISLVFNY
jgi:hypothetical protein